MKRSCSFRERDGGAAVEREPALGECRDQRSESCAVGTYVDVGHPDPSFGWGRVAGDRRETPAVRDGPERSCRPAAGGVHSSPDAATIVRRLTHASGPVTVADVYVRADGARLAALVAALADGMLSLHLGAMVPLTEAAAALQTAAAGRASGATVLTLSDSPATLPQNHY